MRRSKELKEYSNYDVLMTNIEDILLLHNGYVIVNNVNMLYGTAGELNVAETIKQKRVVMDSLFGRIKIDDEGNTEGRVDFSEEIRADIRERFATTYEMLEMMR